MVVFRANLHTPPQLNTAAFVPAIPSFLGFVAISIIRLSSTSRGLKIIDGPPDEA
jgi:hypothetical protein